MSEYVKDELAVVIGTVLVMLVWLVIWGGAYRLFPDPEMDSRSAESQPVSAVGTASVGLER